MILPIGKFARTRQEPRAQERAKKGPYTHGKKINGYKIVAMVVSSFVCYYYYYRVIRTPRHFPGKTPNPSLIHQPTTCDQYLSTNLMEPLISDCWEKVKSELHDIYKSAAASTGYCTITPAGSGYTCKIRKSIK